jgi:hypothetical protein
MELQSIRRSRSGGRVPPGLIVAASVPLCVLVATSSWFGPSIGMWAGFAVLFFLPGVPLVLLALGRALDPFEKAAASFVGSLVVLTAAALLSHVFGWSLNGVLCFIPLAAGIMGLVHWGLTKKSASRAGEASDVGGACEPSDSFYTKTVSATTWVLLAVAVLWSAGVPGEMGWTTDAFDHIATVREISDTGDLFPLSAWYSEPEAPLPDPRKGVFHVGLAALCRLSGRDPAEVWLWLPGALLPLALLVVFCLGRILTGSWAGGWLAALFWLMCFGGPNSRLPAQMGYAHNISEAASWFLIVLMLKYVSDHKRELVLASAVGLVACCFVHISSFVLLMASWGCFLAAALVLGGDARRGLCGRLGRVGLVWLGFGVLAAAAKVLMSYAPANPIQVQTQNLLYWGSWLHTVNPLWVFGWLGLPGVLAIVIAVGLAVRGRRNPGTLYMAGASIVPVAVVLNPLVVPLLYGVIGYLVERFTWIIPYPHVLAFTAVASYRRLILPGSALPRLGAGFLLGCVLLSVGATAANRPDVRVAEADRTVPWMHALDYLQSEADAPAVVASDLLTSYSVPAFTRHHVVSTLHQHGSPNDPRGSDRIVALMEIMNPDLPGALLKRKLKEQEVDFFLINRSFDTKLMLHYAEVDTVSLTRLKERLEGLPGVFGEVYDKGGVSIFAVDGAGLRKWTPRDTGPPPYVLRPDATLPGLPVGAVFDGKVELLSVELPRRPVEPGRSFRITCYWRSRTERLEFDIPWVVQIRMQKDYPKGRLYSPAYGKIYRKLVELIRGERYRWRDAHLPARGLFPPSLWEDFIVKDTADVYVPRWMDSGTYELSVFIGRRAIYPNLTVRDFLRDDDQYSGVTVGSLEIR